MNRYIFRVSGQRIFNYLDTMETDGKEQVYVGARCFPMLNACVERARKSHAWGIVIRHFRSRGDIRHVNLPGTVLSAEMCCAPIGTEMTISPTADCDNMVLETFLPIGYQLLFMCRATVQDSDREGVQGDRHCAIRSEYPVIPFATVRRSINTEKRLYDGQCG